MHPGHVKVAEPDLHEIGAVLGCLLKGGMALT